MELRYDFTENMDLNLFRKQFLHFFSTKDNIKIYVYTVNYYLVIILTPSSKKESFLYILLSKIEKDNESIINTTPVFPIEDKKFSYSKGIVDLFDRSKDTSTLKLDKLSELCDGVCEILNICHRLDKLKAFE